MFFFMLISPEKLPSLYHQTLSRITILITFFNNSLTVVLSSSVGFPLSSSIYSHSMVLNISQLCCPFRNKNVLYFSSSNVFPHHLRQIKSHCLFPFPPCSSKSSGIESISRGFGRNCTLFSINSEICV